MNQQLQYIKPEIFYKPFTLVQHSLIKIN